MTPVLTFMATSPVPPHAMAVPWNLGLIEYTHPESRGADCHRPCNVAEPQTHASALFLPTAGRCDFRVAGVRTATVRSSCMSKRTVVP